jgi:hypothetical protein
VNVSITKPIYKTNTAYTTISQIRLLFDKSQKNRERELEFAIRESESMSVTAFFSFSFFFFLFFIFPRLPLVVSERSNFYTCF